MIHFSDGGRKIVVDVGNGVLVSVVVDSSGRLTMMQSSDSSSVRHFHWDASRSTSSPTAISEENLETGVVRYRLLFSKSGHQGLKVAAGDEQCYVDGNCTTGDSPFGDWWGWNWSQGRTPPEREKCNVECTVDCNRDYDIYGNLLCAGITAAFFPTAVGAALAGGACLAALGALKPYDCQTTCTRRCR